MSQNQQITIKFFSATYNKKEKKMLRKKCNSTELYPSNLTLPRSKIHNTIVIHSVRVERASLPACPLRPADHLGWWLRASAGPPPARLPRAGQSPGPGVSSALRRELCAQPGVCAPRQGVRCEQTLAATADGSALGRRAEGRPLEVAAR